MINFHFFLDYLFCFNFNNLVFNIVVMCLNSRQIKRQGLGCVSLTNALDFSLFLFGIIITNLDCFRKLVFVETVHFVNQTVFGS